MARYIDADKLCKGLKEMAIVQPADKQSTILGVVSTIENMPTADVVPKSELSIIGVQNMALVNTKEDLQRRLVAVESVASAAIEKASDMVIEAKHEVAREIFEEIEGIIIKYYNYLTNNDELKLLDPIKQAQGFLLNMILKDIDELNEKYTEGETNGNKADTEI